MADRVIKKEVGFFGGKKKLFTKMVLRKERY